MRRLPEEAPVELATQSRMTAEDLGGIAPAQRDPALAKWPQVVDGMTDHCLRHVCDLRPRLEGPPGEVGVLAAGRRVTLVEAAEPLEQVARVGDVAGLVPGPGGRDLDRAGEEADPAPLARDRLGSTLQHNAGVRHGCGTEALEPAHAGFAVVVGEG